MKLSNVFFATHGAVVLFSVGLVIIGLIGASHRVPKSSCIGSTQGGESDIDDVNKWGLISGLLAVFAGSLSLFASIIGTIGAWKERKPVLQSARLVLTVAILAAVVYLSLGFLVQSYGCADYTCTGQVCFRVVEQGDDDIGTKSAPKEPDASEQGASQQTESAFDNLIQSDSAPRCTPSDNQAGCTFQFICAEDHEPLCKGDGPAIPFFFGSLIASIVMCSACCAEGAEAAPGDDVTMDVTTGGPAQRIGADGSPPPQGQIIQVE